MRKDIRITGVILSSAVLFGAASVQAAAQWSNALGDNVMTNAGNWTGDPLSSTAFLDIGLAGADRAIMSDGMSLTVNDIRVGIDSEPGLVGELEITGGFLRSDRSSGDTRIGYNGRTGIVNQSGGEWEVAQDFALPIGSSGTGIYNLSGGELDNQRGTFQIGKPGGGLGTFTVSGGILKTRFDATIFDGGTFRVEGTNAASVQIGGSASGNGTWTQESGAIFSVGISTGGVTVTEVVGATGTATFQFGSLLDVEFLDGFVETNTWTIMTSQGAMTDNGLEFSSNVNISNWSFAVTNNELQVTYGEGSEPPPTNSPPSGPRDLWWAASATNSTDMLDANNWVTNDGFGVWSPATWGLNEGDTIYIGSHVNPGTAEGVVYEATYSGGTPKNQGALRIGENRTGVLNFNSGDLDFERGTWQCRIGFGTRGHGTLNMNGGVLEVDSLQLGLGSTSDGAINQTNGTFLIARGFSLNGRNTSLSIGQDGTGTNIISGGILDMRFGVDLGHNGGTGLFSVEGSDATLIGTGTKNAGSDGYWKQNTGSTLKARIDDGGVTPITVVGYGGDGGDVTFETNSILDIGWAAGVTNYGLFDLMTFNGGVTDNGLVLSTNVDTSIWSFSFVDTDADTTNDTLRVTADPGTTAQGTPLLWLSSYGLTEAAEFLDVDLPGPDGLLTWEEYIAGTDPTNQASVLTITDAGTDGVNYNVTWQSVAGRVYSVNAATDLQLGFTPDATNIVGLAGETSHTGTVSGASAEFLQIEVALP